MVRGLLCMKKRLLALLCALFVCVPWLAAQGKTEIVLLGKNKSTVSSMQAGGHTLVDGQATAKKLGGTVEIFSASRQLKIAFPGMYAILSAPLKETIINAKTIPLRAEVVASGGKIYVPVEFFMLPQVQKALDRQITFEKNRLIVERNYTLEFVSDAREIERGLLRFEHKGAVTAVTEQPDAHTVKVLFKDVVLKREASQRPKSNLIRSFSLSQRGKDAELKIGLGNAKPTWEVSDQESSWAWKASSVPPVIKAVPEKVVTVEDVSRPDPIMTALPAPSVTAELQEEETESVLDTSADEEDDAAIEELDLYAVAEVPVMTAAPAAVPVMKPVPVPVMKSKDMVRIVIDAGHGGKDPGAVRRGSQREKDLNLAVAKHVYNYLKKQHFDVKLTRDNDTFVTLAGRSRMANDFKADLFISIHTNAAKNTKANGFEVYFRSDKATDKEAAEVAAFENEALQYEETHYSFVDKLLQSLAKNEYMNESSKLAGHIRNNVYKESGIGIMTNKNSAIRQANFYVLRGVQSPAVLIEMGYISSPKDRSRLNNKSAQKHLGEGIGKGVVAYLKQEGKIK